ncbi:hypothetical protein OGAPHI_005609 [Ogataea philodendri]|uniref:Uncharacterized protein n=1 Tax=Ogataea philodendri TaxID=1378263 RepID=A0A9P8NZC9_9ASCO|nr:uncharacterized protein OGAPHI_005609 [Ogataea philodendri]KAH3662357.1 hypothetical protein OGAPHI_005609 [Ogataea philodendri]
MNLSLFTETLAKGAIFLSIHQSKDNWAIFGLPTSPESHQSLRILFLNTSTVVEPELHDLGVWTEGRVVLRVLLGQVDRRLCLFELSWRGLSWAWLLVFFHGFWMDIVVHESCIVRNQFELAEKFEFRLVNVVVVDPEPLADGPLFVRDEIERGGSRWCKLVGTEVSKREGLCGDHRLPAGVVGDGLSRPCGVVVVDHIEH